MARTTFGKLVSISGRAILAIGLTSATLFSLAPSAKAVDPAPSGDTIMVNLPETETMAFVSTSGTTAVTLTKNAALVNGKVGTLQIESNNGNGFTVTASSSTGTLVGTNLASVPLPYSVHYNTTGLTDGAANAFTAGTTGSILDISALDPLYSADGGKTADIGISISQSDVAAAASDTYSDTLTFTYTGK